MIERKEIRITVGFEPTTINRKWNTWKEKEYVMSYALDYEGKLAAGEIFLLLVVIHDEHVIFPNLVPIILTSIAVMHFTAFGYGKHWNTGHTERRVRCNVFKCVPYLSVRRHNIKRGHSERRPKAVSHCAPEH